MVKPEASCRLHLTVIDFSLDVLKCWTLSIKSSDGGELDLYGELIILPL